MISDFGPTWRGIIVGQSTADDVISALGEPTSVVEESAQTVYLYQEGRFEWAVHRVVIRDNVVEYVEEDVLAYSYDIRLTQLIEQYGAPYYVMWSREGPELRVVIFLEQGILANVTALPLDEAQVTWVLYYRPRSLARLFIDFRDRISAANPFPDSDIVGARDPWREEP